MEYLILRGHISNVPSSNIGRTSIINRPSIQQYGKIGRLQKEAEAIKLLINPMYVCMLYIKLVYNNIYIYI